MPEQKGASGEAVTLPDEASSGWWVQVQKDIQESEYHVTWQDETPLPDLKSAWQSPNRQQNFRTYFTSEGIRVIPRTASEEEKPLWEWGLKLERYGMRDQLHSVETAKITTSGNRVSYERGTMTEWSVNGSDGLEQGFTLNSAPQKHERRDERYPLKKTEEQTELIVEMSVTGTSHRIFLKKGSVWFLKRRTGPV